MKLLMVKFRGVWSSSDKRMRFLDSSKHHGILERGVVQGGGQQASFRGTLGTLLKVLIREFRSNV